LNNTDSFAYYLAVEEKSATKYCVYTIIDGKELVRHRSQPFSDTQARLWVTAHKLWQQGTSANESMPIVLGDATDCSRLLYWGFLTDLQIDRRDATTTFAVDLLRKIKGTHSPQELRLRSSGKTIASNFIRPYAICLTPQFIKLA
jgi:hypothetical protein